MFIAIIITVFLLGKRFAELEMKLLLIEVRIYIDSYSLIVFLGVSICKRGIYMQYIVCVFLPF